MPRGRIVDISLPVSPETVVWPGDPPVSLEFVCEQPNVVSNLSLSVHAGTHIDAPLHRGFGKSAVEAIPLEHLCGPVYVTEASSVDESRLAITALPPLPDGIARLLIRTGIGDRRRTYRPEIPWYYGLAPELSRFLLDAELVLIGTDAPSIEPPEAIERGDFTTHDLFLDRGIVLLENLDLSLVSSGWYDLFCLPLKLIGTDGAPARAILVER